MYRKIDRGAHSSSRSFCYRFRTGPDKDRTEPLQSLADLLWFPRWQDGGIPGVAAFAMAIRRLRQSSGYDGLEVWPSSYDTRCLLTIQQFQRYDTSLRDGSDPTIRIRGAKSRSASVCGQQVTPGQPSKVAVIGPSEMGNECRRLRPPNLPSALGAARKFYLVEIFT
jgi:hypothetical protein